MADLEWEVRVVRTRGRSTLVVMRGERMLSAHGKPIRFHTRENAQSAADTMNARDGAHRAVLAGQAARGS